MGKVATFLQGDFQKKTPLERASSNKEIVEAFFRENPQKTQSFQGLELEQKQEFVDKLIGETRKRFPEAFTVEVSPARKEVRKSSPMEQGNLRLAMSGVHLPERDIVKETPAVTRPLFDKQMELTIEMVDEGVLKPEDLDLENQEALAPFILRAL